MEVNTRDLLRLFQGDKQFRIPLFQRQYVWDLDRQWEPLWEDVTRVANQILEKGEMGVSPHFLGAIVVSQVRHATGDLELRDVIDGQQRLTTLQILADAVEEVIRQAGFKKQSRLLQRLLLNTQDLFDGDDRFKIRPTRADQNAFRSAMDDETLTSPDLADSQIVRAHNYFKTSVEEWCDPVAPDREARFDALVKSISTKLHVVAIDLKATDNHHAIFETLNARGTPLLASDLVKNHLLHQAEQKELSVETLYSQYWQHFEDPWWKSEITLGRLIWPRVDAFLYYWLGMHRARDVNAQELFGAYQDLVDERKWGPQDVASDFCRFSRTFRFLESDKHEGADKSFFERRNLLNLRVLTPILLWLFGHGSQLDGAIRGQCLRLLESWFMRRVLCGHRAQGYQNFLSSLLREMKEKPLTESSTVISAMLKSATATGSKWPKDADVHWAILNRPVYAQSSQVRLRIVLEAVEDSLREKEGKTEDACPKHLQIEHILPVGWTLQDWPLPGPIERRAEVEAERNTMIDTLGNLTLVNEKLNPSLSNLPWKEKRRELDKHSVLLLNRELVRESSWDEESIRKRGGYLGARICQIWPREHV